MICKWINYVEFHIEIRIAHWLSGIACIILKCHYHRLWFTIDYAVICYHTGFHVMFPQWNFRSLNLEYSMDCMPWMALLRYFFCINSRMHRLSFGGEMCLKFPLSGAFLHCQLFCVAIAFPRFSFQSFCWNFVESFSVCSFRFVSLEQICWMSLAWGRKVGIWRVESKTNGFILHITV